MGNKGISDIIVQTKSNQNSFFNEYLSKDIVGGKILNGIINRYQPGKGFALDDNNPNAIGILSNVMALSIFLELYDLEAKGLKEHSYIFSDLLSLIFESLYKEDRIVFDASPYIFNDKKNNVEIETYTETISKVLIVMVDTRDLLLDSTRIRPELSKKSTIKFNVKFKDKNIKEPKELLDIVEKLIIKCMKLLSESALKVDEPFDYKIDNQIIKRPGMPSKCEYRGWSFKSDNENHSLYETSIYFTYHATNAFLCFYNSFYDIFNDRPKDEPFIDEYYEYKYFEDVRFYNEYKPYVDKLRNITSSSARYIDKTINDRGIDLSLDYVTSSLTKMSYADALNHQSTNSIMETLFVTATLINGGIDDDYEYIGQSEYFYDKIQFAITNIRKIYSALQRDKKEDFINTYKLIFNEKINSRHDEMIQKFRKNCQNVKVFDLVPLLANTYSIISDFLIKYPTVEMNTYLKMVMENRNGDENIWYWDKDGFNMNINLYYIFAIENFYNYYFTYENPLSEIGIKYNRDAASARALADKRKEEIKVLKEEKKKLEEEFNAKKSELDEAFETFIFDMFDKNLDKYLNKYLEDMIDQNIDLCIERYNKELRSIRITPTELFEKYPKAKVLRKLIYAKEANRLVKTMDDAIVDNKKIIENVNAKLLQEFEDGERSVNQSAVEFNRTITQSIENDNKLGGNK